MHKKTFLYAVAAVLLTSGLVWAHTADSSAMQPVPGTGSLKPAPGTKFIFIVAGDNRPASDKLPQPPTPAEIFQTAKKEGSCVPGVDRRQTYPT